MVGGTIIEVKREKDKVRLWVVGSRPVEQYDELAIYVDAVAPECAVGDALWWQGSLAFWTPKDRHVIDEPLRKISNSFDPRKEAYN